MSTPDFDKMSPEELMAWMEALARRQGADEGFTSNMQVEVPEVDPTTVGDIGGEYIPFGMSKEQWEEKQRKEREKKEARRAQQSSMAVLASSAPPPAAAPPPAPTSAPAAASATPDFDKMSPEELMAWMESLARRQGADEGFTTTIQMDVPEVDPTTVGDIGGEYIPFGMSKEQWEEKQRKEREKKEARRAQQQTAAPTPLPPAPRPAAAAPPAPKTVAPPEPVFELPPLPLPSSTFTTEDTTQANLVADNPLAWLDSLSAGSGSSGASIGDLPQLDLSALGSPLNVPTMPAEDPMAWLDSLSQGASGLPAGLADLAGLEQLSFDALPPSSAQSASPASPVVTNSLEWLESLARRQGAVEEEFTTSAALDVPLPAVAPISQAPGYTDYTFEAPADDSIGADPLGFLESLGGDGDFELETFEADDEDSSDWLDRIASGDVTAPAPAEKKAPPPQTDQIMDALAKNQVNPSDIENWMANLLEQGVSRSDIPNYVDDDEEEGLVQADLPDWLKDQIGTPPSVQSAPRPQTKPLVSQIVEPPTPAEMPDWLKAAVPDTAAVDLDAIFDEAPSAPAVLSDIRRPGTEEFQIDPTDPWVEAFELERKMGQGDIEQIPDWYAERLGIAPSGADAAELEISEFTFTSVSVPAPAAPMETIITLAAASLPAETELAAGQRQSLPDWLKETVTLPATALPATISTMPQGLLDLDEVNDVEEMVAVPSEIPDWLRDQVPAEDISAAFVSETEELPDWLRGAGVEVDTSDIPDWLKETLSTEEAPVVETVAAAVVVPPVVPKPAPIPTPAPAPAPRPALVSPAIVPAVAVAIDVNGALSAARAAVESGNVDSGLQQYEAVVRANASLDTVTSDLALLLKDEGMKKNPAIYRVLGDSLMRQGKLQDALDTYRKALNLL